MSSQQKSSGWQVWIILGALISALAVVVALRPVVTQVPPSISGRLTLEGQPLAAHTISFMEPEHGDLTSATTDNDGRFFTNTWRGGSMKPGRYKAYVKPPQMEMESSQGVRASAPYLYADRYFDISTTPLEYRIILGENPIDIDLERRAKEPAKPSEAP